ncbi:outer membrane efflux protein [Campylobacter insulaenigrae]|uniref:TolC family protein n=1 Tax=Campylobacter insulaenigrae TaxID=260714 RepID=UPI000F6C6938|nr:TolC family protein [Campylobacter insulaenigrae]MCR6591371.1 TolC family protein [Campylobacter insulaenigrae]MCR6592733.1 TolC family protein [Campylobacter insulaenigrae]VEJ53945.1 outer membrane efflux protein [Campylobacter insulaenigrae]
MKFSIIVFLVLLLSACASIKLEQIHQEQISQQIFKDFNASYPWWQKYNNKILNQILQIVIDNNKDLNVARINLLSSLTKYELLKLDLYPTLSGDLGVNINKNLKNGMENSGFSNGLMLNYELDLYAKISDQIASSNFLVKASEYELQKMKLDVVNLTLNSIFELVYFNDVDVLLHHHLKNLEQMLEIYTTKFDYGKVEYIDLLNIKKSLLNTKQNITINLQNKEAVIKNLKDLLGYNNEKLIDELFSYKLDDFFIEKIDFDIDLKMLSFTPEIQAKFNILNSSYKNYFSIQKSILPSVKILGRLDGKDETINDSFKFLMLGGNVVIDLPFLDFYRVRKNVKISEYEYNIRVLEYKDALQKNLNNFNLCYKNDQYYNSLLEIMEENYINQEKITQLYFNKYKLGRNELKDYLDADALLINSLQELNRARLALLKNINLYHNIVLVSE